MKDYFHFLVFNTDKLPKNDTHSAFSKKSCVHPSYGLEETIFACNARYVVLYIVPTQKRSQMRKTVLSTLLLAGFTSCVASPMLAGTTTPHVGQTEVCEATWYGPGFDRNPMKNGQPYDSNNPSYIAHSTLPMGTIVRVTNLNNGLSVVVEVADRGPNGISGRCVDGTRAVAQELQYYVNERAGEAPVRVEVLELPSG